VNPDGKAYFDTWIPGADPEQCNVVAFCDSECADRFHGRRLSAYTPYNTYKGK
jgi:hypothetical protein